MFHKARYVFWDFNGTLLNDVSICIRSMNTLLEERKMPLLTPEQYRQVFGFPVKDYYERIGFNFHSESFETLSQGFITAYYKHLPQAKLYTSARLVLSKLQNQQKQQVILSAMEHTALNQLVGDYQIRHFFSDVLGIENNYASSKTHIGQKYIADNNLVPSEGIFIGDSTHDYEVAAALGMPAILVADGHQSKNRLVQTGAFVVNNLEELLRLN